MWQYFTLMCELIPLGSLLTKSGSFSGQTPIVTPQESGMNNNAKLIEVTLVIKWYPASVSMFTVFRSKYTIDICRQMWASTGMVMVNAAFKLCRTSSPSHKVWQEKKETNKLGETYKAVLCTGLIRPLGTVIPFFMWIMIIILWKNPDG